jgi:murein DD-endopeptidase MepM/ murein hydrolase activator NlpD
MSKLSIFQPLKTPVVQGFGVNGEWYQQHGINIKGHNGLDYEASHGQPIYATHDGQAFFEWDSNQGEGVVVRSNEMFDFLDGTTSYAKTIYWHMCDGVKEPQFKSPITFTNMWGEGQPVKAGDLIGYADNTGLSTGTHLHFSVKPMLIDESNGTFYNVNQNNGYMGCVDPTPYFNQWYAEDAQQVLSNLTEQVSLYQKVVNLLKSFFSR